MFRMDGDVALVTGAGSGIGAAIAAALAGAGATVVLTDVKREAADREAERLRGSGFPVESEVLDVRDERMAAAVAERVLGRHGRLDVLVNNAGVGHVGGVLQTTAEDFERLWRVNVLGVFLVTRAFLPSMLERRSGRIVNLASIGGLLAVRDRLAYTATKFAVVGFTKAVALDHAREGIRCNCICPGRVETAFVEAMIRQYPDPARARAEMESTQAIRRMARPEEIAAAAVYLASREADSVTGTALVVDGGWSAGK